jgi:hypothetical protein
MFLAGSFVGPSRGGFSAAFLFWVASFLRRMVSKR